MAREGIALCDPTARIGERAVEGRCPLAGEEGDEGEEEELGGNEAWQKSRRQSFAAERKKCLVSRG